MKRGLINLASLTAVQASNALVPLVVFPFAAATVGSQLYARIALGEALSMFLCAAILYSFEVDGVRRVVGLVRTGDTSELSAIFSEVLYARLSLLLVGAPLLLLIAALSGDETFKVTAAWLLLPLSFALQTNWLFQGLQRNMPLAVVTVVTRVGAMLSVLLLVEGEADYLRVPLLIGGFYTLSALAALAYAMIGLRLRLLPVSLASIGRSLRDGKEIFLGNISVSLYRDANVVVLSALGAPSAAVAAYSLAEKAVKALQASTRPLNQFFFPKALAIIGDAGRPTPQIFRRLAKVTLPQIAALVLLILLLVAAIAIAAPRLGWTTAIENADQAFGLALLMSAATMFGVSNFMFGSAGLNALGEQRYLFLAIFGTGIVSLATTASLVPIAGAWGAAAAFVGAEMLLLGLIVRRYFTAASRPAEPL